ncbi:hypothetical protein [Alteromonas sp. H39]|uniref:hypothetical protein n=1 Tax=Alteromonas sp. H39 TaxID=3389876 RepID=UPI0039E1AD01
MGRHSELLVEQADKMIFGHVGCLTYRIQSQLLIQVAESGEKTQEGISALQQYLADLQATSIDTVDLPSAD